MMEINVEVVYALPERQFLLYIKLTKGASVEEAIVQSGILSICEEIDLKKNKIGIYSKITQLSNMLSDGDRVEIYRPLITSPKEMRRKRAKQNKFNPQSH